MRILVAIASYGIANDHYLSQVIQAYNAMPCKVDIVVLSNVTKDLPPGVSIVVGLPTRDPWSLPFAHKSIFADRVCDYDLFIYSEDDILITHENIQAFLRMTNVLPENEIAGFLRVEVGPDGRNYYPDVHAHFHWDSQRVRTTGDHTFAFFTNEHTACYMLTRQQLQRAIDSGGFLVRPHQGKYDLACTASTDPYTQCGFTKMICVSELQAFLVRHLPNKYVGTIYALEEEDFNRQLEVLWRIGHEGQTPLPPLTSETQLPCCVWSKSYYEPCRPEILELIPASTRSVLSIGCGWGATENRLVRSGIDVVGVPLDPVIAPCAAGRGVKIVTGSLETALGTLADQLFDCILILHILHLLRDPAAVLARLIRMLSPAGSLVLGMPTFHWLKLLCWQIQRRRGFKNVGNYNRTGVHPISYGVVRRWLRTCGLVADTVSFNIPERRKFLTRLFLGRGGPWLADEMLMLCKRQ